MLVLLDEHLDALTQELLAEEMAMLVVEGEQTVAACFLHFVLDLPSHACGGGALPGGEAEDMRLRELQLLRQLVGLLEILIALAGKACDNIGADRHSRYKPFGCADDRLVARALIAAGHAAQHCIR